MKKNKKFSLRSVDFLSILIAYVIVIILFSTSSEYFLSVNNFLNIAQYAAVIGVMAMPMTLIMISGNIDISLGSMVAFCSMFVGYFMPQDANDVGGVFLAILLGITIGAAAGAFNGFFITKVKISAFVATMASMNIFRGFAYIFSEGKSIPITNQLFGVIGRGRTFANTEAGFPGIPNTIFIWLAVIVLFWFISQHTVFGRRLFIIGGNSQAAHLSGIKVNKTIMVMYIILGALTGLSAVMTASQLGAALPQGSNGMEFQIISAIVLGGVSMSGGKGNMIGSVLGVMLLATLNNGMVMMEIPSYWQLVVLGFVLILAVSIDVLKQKKFAAT